MNRLRKSLLYVLFDFAASFGAWMMFFVFREQLRATEPVAIPEEKLFLMMVNACIISVYWLIVYALAGIYSDPYRKSRLREVSRIFTFTLAGVIIIFFAFFLDDLKYGGNEIDFRKYFLYFFLQFFFIAFIHAALTSITNRNLRMRKMGFPTLIIGCGEEAERIWSELEGMKRSLGFSFAGYLSLAGSTVNRFHGKLKHFGDMSRLEDIIRSRKIEEVIIALDKEDTDKIMDVVDQLEGLPVKVKIVPGIYDFILGRVKTTHILGSPLVEIFPQLLSPGAAAIKRAMDLTASFLALVILSPLMTGIAIAIRVNSPGPIFFRQERIGKGGKPFRIIKFRSMFIDAEKSGPALSSEQDPRITKVGRFLRKTRLDELPQFWNVLRGDMSLVGPRPERQFFIDQIIKKAPHYRHLLRVRPGVTSWGQVKYGYAENVDQMVERLKFDILYIENMSLGLDVKILLYTVIVMIEGRGK